jgi:hypothetical protein
MLVAMPACSISSSADYVDPGPRPEIVRVEGPLNSTVVCDPDKTGGACPLAITVSFRLPEDQFVRKAYVRFEGDGNDVGVDRGYSVESTYGLGQAEANVKVTAAVPSTILCSRSLFRYSVRLVTGLGAESSPSKVEVTVICKAAEEKDAGTP